MTNMIGGLIDIATLILFLIAIILLFKSKISDITNLLKRKSTLLTSLFVLVIASFIIRIYFPSAIIIPFFFSLILTFVIFDIDRKIKFNKKIDNIKRSIQSKLITPQLNQIKDEQSHFNKEKISLEKQKEKVEEIQIDLENKISDLEKKGKEIEKIQKNIEKERKAIKKDKEKLNKNFERLKKLQTKLKKPAKKRKK